MVRVRDGLLVASQGLTFVTPTLLAGDRSLADVVAHEITHSWFGNLCTNQSWVTWLFWDLAFCVFQIHDISAELLVCSRFGWALMQECFWLNEGFTKFGEARIMANMNGSEPSLHPALFRRISLALHGFSMEMPITWKLGRCQGLWEASSAEWLPSTGPRCGTFWSWARVYQTVCLDGEIDGNGWKWMVCTSRAFFPCFNNFSYMWASARWYR